MRPSTAASWFRVLALVGTLIGATTATVCGDDGQVALKSSVFPGAQWERRAPS